LNIGLTDASVVGLGDDRFAWDSYRRLIQMFGKTVCGVPGEEFEQALDELKQARGAVSDLDLDRDDLRQLVETF
jgi:pyruvate,orthophosphate dikinase